MSDSSRPPAATRDVSVVIPVYGEGAALAQLHARLAAALDARALSWELLLVDDRGSERAWSVIRSIAAADARVSGLRLGRNFGQHAATLCGIAAARGRWVVTMDDDLEHPPEAVPSLLAAGDAEHPLVYGVFSRRTHAVHRNASSALMRWALKKSFPDLNESYSSFRAIHRDVARELAGFRFPRPYLDGLLSWITQGVRTIDIPHGSRTHGRSGYTMRKLVSHAANIFVTFSRIPLRLATYGGIALALASFASLLLIVHGRLTGAITSPGYASLMSVVLLTCGIQLMILGLIGEYVGRLMSAAHQRPPFVVVDRAIGGSVS